MKKDNTHDAGYWTFERCSEIASGFSDTTAFRKAYPYVYGRAKKMGWFDEICSHMVRLYAPNGYWNSKENCINEAKKHESRTSFARNAPTAYWNCLKKGWSEAFVDMRQICDYSITYEECTKIALACKSQAQMRREYPKQYNYAYRHKFLKEIFKHLPKTEHVTKEQAMEAVGKCKLRQEFRIRFPREYRFAVNHHLLDEICKNLPVMHNISERCIYAYEFPDMHVYVGLTCNIERRKREHLYEGNSAVHLYSHETGLEPNFYLKHDYVNYIHAKEIEGIVLREYTDKGWIALNRTGTGGIGCSGNIYSQVKACTERIKFCEDFKQFKERFPDAYGICAEHDWFDLLEEYLGERKGDVFIPKRGFRKKKGAMTLSANFVKRMKGRSVAFRYTDEELMDEAKKHKTKTDFARRNDAAYRQAKDRGFIEEWYPENANLVSNEQLSIEASLYNSRVDFKNGSNAHYQLAMKRGILDEICRNMPYHGYRNERVMLAKESRQANEMGKYWNRERIIEEVTKYHSISDFIERASGAYDAARDLNIMDEIREILKSRYIDWTSEMLADEAKKYTCKVDFRKGSPKAYAVAWKRGILEDICSHMIVLRTNWTYDMLLAEALKYEFRGDFYKGSRKAYDVAHKRGILDKICSHMVKNKKEKK